MSNVEKTAELRASGPVSRQRYRPKQSTNSAVLTTNSGSDRRPERTRAIAGLDLAIEHRSLDSLIPYAKNARTHSEAQIAEIAGSIRAFGWTNPILADGENGIIAGHGRVLAARKLGLESVPVIELSGLSEAERRAYVLADNKLALNAGWDEAMLGAEVADLAALGVDLALLGFDGTEIDRLLAGTASHLDGTIAPNQTPPSSPTAAFSQAAVLAIVMSLLAGCATARSDGAPCPPVVPYSREFLARAADELERLPAGSAIEQMLADYQVMRDQARACRTR